MVVGQSALGGVTLRANEVLGFSCSVRDWVKIPPPRSNDICVQLYPSRVFNIKLSSPQLAAVIAKFDKNQNGTVDCAEFLLQVLTVGSQVRGLVETRHNGHTVVVTLSGLILASVSKVSGG